ncbi:MarR family winged helix-turn-helix transcriptional regulator [Exiguobacterium sp. CinTr1]|uniref:MarR family winged helix-turn-helix transcriptional regulator n=1 Tax=Exiguobacterium sp. CinTr1 TaxID=2995315 RepID=UPI0022E1C73D|nr:MarR family transcriptional regulator [Exiguobacterium sp. CinTr1]
MTETNTNRAREMMQSFWRVQRVLIRLMHQTAQQNDLTLPQLHGLMMLNEQGAITQKELVQRTRMPKSTLSQSLDGLVEKGLIRRDINPDNRREVVLTIDQSGKRLIEEVERQEEGTEYQLNQILSRLDQDTYDHMLTAHQHIADGLNEGLTDCEGVCRHD